MSFARSYDIAFTTDGSGDATAYSGEKVNGRILEVRYTYGDADTGADFTITGRTSGRAVLTVTNAGTSDAVWAPRQPTHDTSAAASLYAAAGEPVEDYIWLVDEEIKLVVASGGATKAGTLTFIVG